MCAAVRCTETYTKHNSRDDAGDVLVVVRVKLAICHRSIFYRSSSVWCNYYRRWIQLYIGGTDVGLRFIRIPVYTIIIMGICLSHTEDDEDDGHRSWHLDVVGGGKLVIELIREFATLQRPTTTKLNGARVSNDNPNDATNECAYHQKLT